MSGEAKQNLLFGLVVAAIAFLTYANSLGNGFVWDDDVVILANPALKGSALALFSGIDTGRATELTPYYRPLTLLSFLVEERVHGFTPFLVRLFNVLLHAVNSFLVYRVARSLFARNYPALLAGLLFAIHPLNSEGVDFNAGGRNTMLACGFVLAAYLLHRNAVTRERLASAVAGAVLVMAGLFSKESAVALLPFIGVLEIPALRTPHGGSRRKAVIRLLPYAVVAIIYVVLRSQALASAGVTVDVFSGLGTRLLQNIYIIPRYMGTILWPPLQSAKYFIPDDLHLLALPLATAWLCIGVMLWWLFTRGRTSVTLFGVGWFVAFWLPVSGIVPIPSAPMADRYLYLPAIGIWLVVADQVVRALRDRRAVHRYAVSAIIVVLLVFAQYTVRRNLVWKSDISLFSRIVVQYPDRAFGHHNLGCAYLDKEKNLGKAEQEFAQALALNPFFPRLRTQMGYICLQQGDFAGALSHYSAAVQINPRDAEAHLNRGIVLEGLGRYGEAVSEYRQFLATPGNELPGARPMAEDKVRGLSQYLDATGRR